MHHHNATTLTFYTIFVTTIYLLSCEGSKYEPTCTYNFFSLHVESCNKKCVKYYGINIFTYQPLRKIDLRRVITI